VIKDGIVYMKFATSSICHISDYCFWLATE